MNFCTCAHDSTKLGCCAFLLLPMQRCQRSEFIVQFAVNKVGRSLCFVYSNARFQGFRLHLGSGWNWLEPITEQYHCAKPWFFQCWQAMNKPTMAYHGHILPPFGSSHSQCPVEAYEVPGAYADPSMEVGPFLDDTEALSQLKVGEPNRTHLI